MESAPRDSHCILASRRNPQLFQRLARVWTLRAQRVPRSHSVREGTTIAVDADFGFAAYHSKTEVKGNVLAYSRTYEIKELSVPVSRAQDLKNFHRIIASDERNTAVLKPAD